MPDVFDEVSFDNEDMHCPNCDSYLGIVKRDRGPRGGTSGSVSFQID